jgi:rubrerythrin
MIFDCFAAACKSNDMAKTAESFVDVEEYENRVMYPEFARWASKVGTPSWQHCFAKWRGKRSYMRYG